ncbi:OsmC family protein [Fodinibius sediminis]|uniref:Peroxiredoxin, SACOL1771 subfamily n=1 Tax=Fodinibius sediminis TaxID=1214077 RepID=A0A521BKI8_9BACT|nr:OsmC family protein [Fodinibius sediminis]SMO47654.1 peroxiredoxin, SACOL1771 subfamily [Fodinibius sediminis]
MSNKEYFYDVNISWQEGRQGTMSSPGLEEVIEVATPPEFEGGIPGKWSPEHLFVASVSSCLMTTFTAIAEFSKLAYESLNIKALGKMAKKEGRFMMTEITLEPELIITNEKLADKARRILEKAEKNCLITRSIRTDIIFTPRVVVAALD